jgi:hypothetical protein
MEILADDHKRELVGPGQIRLGKIAKARSDHNQLATPGYFQDSN